MSEQELKIAETNIADDNERTIIMTNPKVYLDNCCYNRPFGDLSRESIRKETDAKLYIQRLCRCTKRKKARYIIRSIYRS